MFLTKISVSEATPYIFSHATNSLHHLFCIATQPALPFFEHTQNLATLVYGLLSIVIQYFIDREC